MSVYYKLDNKYSEYKTGRSEEGSKTVFLYFVIFILMSLYGLTQNCVDICLFALWFNLPVNNFS